MLCLLLFPYSMRASLELETEGPTKPEQASSASAPVSCDCTPSSWAHSSLKTSNPLTSKSNKAAKTSSAHSQKGVGRKSEHRRSPSTMPMRQKPHQDHCVTSCHSAKSLSHTESGPSDTKPIVLPGSGSHFPPGPTSLYQCRHTWC